MKTFHKSLLDSYVTMWLTDSHAQILIPILATSESVIFHQQKKNTRLVTVWVMANVPGCHLIRDSTHSAEDLGPL